MRYMIGIIGALLLYEAVAQIAILLRRREGDIYEDGRRNRLRLLSQQGDVE